MNQADVRLLYEYNYWANARIREAAAHLPPELWTAPARVSFGSLRGTLVHALSTEWLWRVRCQEGVSPTALLAEEDFPTLATVAERWDAEEAAMRSFLGQLDDADVSRTVRYTNTKGVPYADILGHLLLHVVNHGTQFRGEAGVVLSTYGHSPGDLDLILFLRTEGQRLDRGA